VIIHTAAFLEKGGATSEKGRTRRGARESANMRFPGIWEYQSINQSISASWPHMGLCHILVKFTVVARGN
jgi:hypothetical protein